MTSSNPTIYVLEYKPAPLIDARGIAFFDDWDYAWAWAKREADTNPAIELEQLDVVEWMLNPDLPTAAPVDDPTNPHPNDGMVDFGGRTVDIGEVLEVYTIDRYGRREL